MSSDELRALLLEREEAERVNWLAKAVGTQPYAGFRLARRLRLSRASVRSLVEQTVDCADANTIRWWLEFYAYASGFRRTMELVRQWKATRPETARSAAYWLGEMPGADTPEGRRLIDAYARHTQ